MLTKLAIDLGLERVGSLFELVSSLVDSLLPGISEKEKADIMALRSIAPPNRIPPILDDEAMDSMMSPDDAKATSDPDA